MVLCHLPRSLLLYIVLVGPLIAQVQVGVSVPSLQCLGCMCEALSSCNLLKGCIRGSCGPFLITKPYWVDAGKPVIKGDDPENDEAWINCANDFSCAATTARNYVTRYRQDCNKDGLIDCLDFLSIHYLGPTGCMAPLDPHYQKLFMDCLISLAPVKGKQLDNPSRIL